MAYYQVKSEEMIKKMDNWFGKRDKAVKAAASFCRSIPGASTSYYPSSDGGGVRALVFEKGKVPEFWVEDSVGGHRPHGAKKEVKEVRDRMYSLPIVEKSELTTIIEYGTYCTTGKMSTSPGISKTLEGVYLIETSPWVDEFYTAPDGIVEILSKDFQEFKNAKPTPKKSRASSPQKTSKAKPKSR